jgi:pyruvate,water dikinase
MRDRGDVIVPLPGGDGVTAERVGPKAATLARLHAAGLPVPEGFCLTADAYRTQIAAAGVEEAAARVAGADDPHEARRFALAVRLALIRAPLAPSVVEGLAAAFARLTAEPGTLVAVRSSALLEDSPAVSFAGQFESFLGIGNDTDLVTAVRACWASLWSTRALRYMQTHEVDPARTAMAVLVQKLVPAQAAGGALSRTPEDEVLITGTWGLGSAIAQGEVVPDRFVLDRDGSLLSVEPGRKERVVICSPEAGPFPRAVAAALVAAPCLAEDEAVALGRLVLETEVTLGMPVEIEWAKDPRGFRLLQARPLTVESGHVEDEVWRQRPKLRGQPAGLGWATGPARVVLHEHDLEHVSLGDVLVTQVAGPALTAVLPKVVGVVAELGGSTSHLAALARERGIPAVLGVLDATRRIPEGALVAVDGVAGVVRWIA